MIYSIKPRIVEEIESVQIYDLIKKAIRNEIRRYKYNEQWVLE